MTSPNHHALTCMSGCEFRAAGSSMTVMIHYSVIMKFLTSPTHKFKLWIVSTNESSKAVRFQSGPAVAARRQSLPSSTKKPTFHPPGHQSAATAKAWMGLRSESYDLYEPVVCQIIIVVSADLLMAWRLFGTNKTIHHHLWHLIGNRRHIEKKFRGVTIPKKKVDNIWINQSGPVCTVWYKTKFDSQNFGKRSARLAANISSQFHHLITTGLPVGSLVKWLPIKVANPYKVDKVEWFIAFQAASMILPRSRWDD